MIKITKYSFVSTMCLLFALSLSIVSCDSDDDLMVDEAIVLQRNVLPQSPGMMTDGACKTLAENMNAIQAYVADVKHDEYNPSKRELAHFVYDLNVQKGLIEFNDKSKIIFADALSSNLLVGDAERIITNLYERRIISKDLSDIFREFRIRFSVVENSDQAYEVILGILSSKYYRSLSPEEKYIFEEAMNAAESGVCYLMTDGGEAMNFWDRCPECIGKQHSAKAITLVTITVAVGLHEVDNYELSTQLSFVLTTGVWALNYFNAPNRASGPCPDGQEPYCETGFNLNLDDGLCEMLDGLEGAILSTSNCIWVDKLPNGDCPAGTISIPGASQCLLVCFGDEVPDGIGQNEAGQFIYPIECRTPCEELSPVIYGEGNLCINEYGEYCIPEEYTVVWAGHPDINGSTDNCVSLSYDSEGIETISANVELNDCSFLISKTIRVLNNEPCEIPNVPPIQFDNICMGETVCYDFSGWSCLESLQVTSSSSKVVVGVDGTKVCLSSIFHKHEDVVLTVTPIGYCGNGDTVTWNITVNDPLHCGDGGLFDTVGDLIDTDSSSEPNDCLDEDNPCPCESASDCPDGWKCVGASGSKICIPL